MTYSVGAVLILSLMARPKGVKEKKKRNRKIPSSKVGGPKELGLTIPEALTIPEQIIWNKYERVEGKKGGEALFNHPDQMALAAMSYFRWCDANPIPNPRARYTNDDVGIGFKRPYNIINFCHWCGVTGSWFRNWRRHMDNHPEFSSIVEFVEEACRTQQLEGAQVGQFNATITALMNGLAWNERRNEESSTAVVQSIPEIKVYNTAPPLASDESEVEVTIVSSKPLKKKLNGKR